MKKQTMPNTKSVNIDIELMNKLQILSKNKNLSVDTIIELAISYYVRLLDTQNSGYVSKDLFISKKTGMPMTGLEIYNLINNTNEVEVDVSYVKHTKGFNAK